METLSLNQKYKPKMARFFLVLIATFLLTGCREISDITYLKLGHGLDGYPAYHP